jgi:GT2 family glycosyltransferase
MLIQKPKVLIGITTKNRVESLIKCINSIKLLEYPNYKIRVFCDGCTDNTETELLHYPDIEVIVNKESIGLKKARNKLMESLDFKYFVTLDDDTYFIKNDTLTKCIDFLEQNENIGIVSLDIKSRNYIHDNSLPNINLKPFQISEFIGCGNIIKIDVLNTCGFYNVNNLPYGTEEQELAINCLKMNFLIYYLPGALLVHNEYQNNRSYSKQWISTVNNVLYITYFYYPFYLWPILIIFKALILLKYGLFHKKFVLTLLGIYHFVFKQDKCMPVYYFGRLTFEEFILFRILKNRENFQKNLIS